MSKMELMEAARTGTAAEVAEALASGTEVNQQDGNGWTPLCWAAGRGDLAVVQLLVERGADVWRTGRDLRTPAMIAIAAGRVEAARFLRETEAARPGPDARATPPRKYCKAYYLDDLRKFAGFGAAAADAPRIAYLHETYQVTRSMWADEEVLFDAVTPEWRAFCTNELAFAVPDDLDLIGHAE